LGCTIGYQTGNPGIKVVSGSGNGTFVVLPGYPGDKGGTTMWTSGGTIQETQTLLFFYDNDTAESESGAPVWVTEPMCNPCVVAVNAQEYAPPILNSGPRITTEAFNFLLSR
jgi:V8-like Glu-specific endopeptidase